MTKEKASQLATAAFGLFDQRMLAEAQDQSHHRHLAAERALKALPEPTHALPQRQGEKACLLLLTSRSLFELIIEPPNEQSAAPIAVRSRSLEDPAAVVELDWSDRQEAILPNGPGYLTTWRFRFGSGEAIEIGGVVWIENRAREVDEAEEFARALAGQVGWSEQLPP